MDKVMFSMIDTMLNNRNLDVKWRLYILLCLFRKNNRKIMATNAYLAYRLGVNDQAIKRALKWLKKAELINLYYFPKNKRGIVVNFALREGEKRPIIPHIDIPIDTFFDYSTEE